jgi:Flp pilus assembly pilin Flp
VVGLVGAVRVSRAEEEAQVVTALVTRRRRMAVRCLWAGCRKGLATVEYALLLALLVAATCTVWAGLSQGMRDMLQSAINSFARYPGS